MNHLHFWVAFEDFESRLLLKQVALLPSKPVFPPSHSVWTKASTHSRLKTSQIHFNKELDYDLASFFRSLQSSLWNIICKNNIIGKRKLSYSSGFWARSFSTNSLFLMRSFWSSSFVSRNSVSLTRAFSWHACVRSSFFDFSNSYSKCVTFRWSFDRISSCFETSGANRWMKNMSWLSMCLWISSKKN